MGQGTGEPERPESTEMTAGEHSGRARRFSG
uniref:Uncharacterized protein n=1 Tax=Arundo donax TaxID=35708 RepID=A0A0A9E1V5_ARUDO